MDSDGAASALGIAQRAYDSGDVEKALRFCKKSIAMSPSATASFLLKKLASGVPSSSSASASTSGSSSATAPPATNAHTRPAVKKAQSAPEPEKRDYTPDQLALVKKVKACRVTESVALAATWHAEPASREQPGADGELFNAATTPFWQ